ncbi:ATP-binding protein [Prevotella sp. E9-3]|uniref:sensor histidine kinase n=1 Tax=Prevotella sp. E9-3 TaxID=2913621 RepID=UPI001EDAB4DA|nr:ATP-binding protein [Prevotella sp. E9-3]UKK47093.1 ATP-binding protein [Prevotella sp. E9-3]
MTVATIFTPVSVPTKPWPEPHKWWCWNKLFLFEEFVQLDQYYNGTGIGLTVARSLARRIGGKIWLDTSYNTGARFILQLPLL